MDVTIRHLVYKDKFVLLKNCTQIPRVGDSIRVFHEPWPKVTDVLWDEELASATVIVNQSYRLKTFTACRYADGLPFVGLPIL